MPYLMNIEQGAAVGNSSVNRNTTTGRMENLAGISVPQVTNVEKRDP